MRNAWRIIHLTISDMEVMVYPDLPASLSYQMPLSHFYYITACSVFVARYSVRSAIASALWITFIELPPRISEQISSEGRCLLMCEIYLNQFRISLRNFIKDFVDDEEAIGTVEMILILIVLIALVIIFRDQLKTIVNNLFDKITTQSNSV